MSRKRLYEDIIYVNPYPVYSPGFPLIQIYFILDVCILFIVYTAVMISALALLYYSSFATGQNATAGPTSGSAPPQPPSPGCTTLEPLFGFPSDGTSTIFPTITTTTSTVDCRGCTPSIKIFNYSISDPVRSKPPPAHCPCTHHYLFSHSLQPQPSQTPSP